MMLDVFGYSARQPSVVAATGGGGTKRKNEAEKKERKMKRVQTRKNSGSVASATSRCDDDKFQKNIYLASARNRGVSG